MVKLIARVPLSVSTRVDVPLAIGALEMPPGQVGSTDDPSPTRMATEWLINCSEARILTEKLRLGALLLLLLLLFLALPNKAN